MAADNSKRVYGSIFDLLPNVDNPTPLVRLHKLVPSEQFELYAKLEWVNPFGSVKDRAAWYMLKELETNGQLSEQRGIVEASSGNTGLSLTALARARGYRARVVIPNKVPLEKKILLKIAGAELDVLNDSVCPAPGMGDGSINLAKTHARAQPDRYIMPNQYENEQNIRAHYETTGPEIWKQTDGRITHFFASLGTCGTVMGVGKFLKEKNPKIKVIAVQPSEGHDVPGIRNISQLDVSKLFDRSLVDDVMEIDHELAYRRAVDLAQSEGLLAGPSAALIFEGARRVVERTPSGVGVMIFCDNVFKYTSNMVKHLPELGEGTTV
jgi:cysteine synthase